MKGSEPKPVKEIILIKHCKNEKGHWVVLTSERALKAMQVYAEAYHKEKLRDIFDKINCLTGYLERWLNNPLSVPPFELKDVIKESNEWMNEYLKTKL